MEPYSPSLLYQQFTARQAEKSAVRKTAHWIGLAYLLLQGVPYACGYLCRYIMTVFGLSSGEMASVMQDPAFLQVLQIYLSIFVMIVPFLLVLSGEKLRINEVISFRKPQKGLFLPYVLIGIGSCFFANIAAGTIANFFSSIGFSYNAPPSELPEGVFGTILVVLSVAVTPPLVEEFAMRGIVMGSLKKYGEEFAILVSAILFGMMHGNFMQIPFAFIIGLAIGAATMKTGSIWTGVTIHFINNGMALLMDCLISSNDSLFLQNILHYLYFAACCACLFIGIALLKGKGSEATRFAPGEMRATTGTKCGWFFSAPLMVVSIVVTVLISLLAVVMYA